MTLFNPGLQPLLQQAQSLASRHRRGLMATALLLLSGFGVTAFGIAPLAPDAALLPQRLVQEPVLVEGVARQADLLADQVLNLRRSDTTRSGDTPAALLARLGVADASAAGFLRTEPTLRKLFAGRGGKLVHAEVDTEGTLRELVVRFPAEQSEQARTHFSRVTVSRVEGRWTARQETLPLQAQLRMGSGTIRNTLFGATDEAGLPDAIASQLAELFSAEIDFHRELRKGDTFSVLYEALTADGEPVTWNEGAGRVVAAEFVNNGRAYHSVWFDRAGGKGGYFGLDGKSKRRMFLASPMEFSRITSGFAMRFHPLMQKWRAHLGVDYGAPTGTPVRTVGEGVVEFSGWQNGYGNVVQIKHGNQHSTLYAHLSKIDVKKGQRVEQGQRIGAVGSTGWSTGPHLHFEFRVNGRHQDPLKVAKASEAVALDSASRAKFAELAQSLQVKLDLAGTTAGAKARFE
ncbi:MAG: peptidoglycan DD-metalloendopeptidase family protein [Rubrivivax sp.]